MASRPKGFGMTAELREKKDAKWDPNQATQVLTWIHSELGDSCGVNPAANDQDSVHEQLKSGVVLMQFAHKLGLSKAKINESKMAFKMMENIGNFLQALDEAGVHKADSFQTVDLYEAQNMPQVMSAILALGRKKGVGPKEATRNTREFTEEQLAAGKNIIGLQMGTNKGASQAGQNFGKARSIMD